VSDQVGGQNGTGSLRFSRTTKLRAIVVTVTVPNPIPAVDEKEFGVTEQVVATAGRVQETFTAEEKPNSGVIKMG
jgi:hypothetical protein